MRSAIGGFRGDRVGGRPAGDEVGAHREQQRARAAHARGRGFGDRALGLAPDHERGMALAKLVAQPLAGRPGVDRAAGQQLLDGGVADGVGAAHPALALQRIAPGDQRGEHVAGLERGLRYPLDRVGQPGLGNARANLPDSPPPERELGHAVGASQIGHGHVASRELARESDGLRWRIEVRQRRLAGQELGDQGQVRGRAATGRLE